MAAGGEIATWALASVRDNLAQYAITAGLSYLGIEGGDDVDAKLDEMNAKLDTILSQLDILNTKVDQLSDSISQLTAEVDIGLKKDYAELSEARFVDVYGAIARKFGSRGASGTNLFSIMHLQNGSGKAGAAQKARPFIAALSDHWSNIHAISDTLTIKVGSSESLLQKWASLMVAKLHAQGPSGVKFGSYASVYEAWYTEAVSYQLKAFAIVLFCIGTDRDSQTAAREQMRDIMQKQGNMYLDGLERMVLAVASTAPSGSGNPVQAVKWPPGAGKWLLRGDVLTKALNLAVTPGLTGWATMSLSGAYGRTLLRPSDVLPDNSAPTRIAFSKPRILRYWQDANKPGAATLGSLTEFQGVDWSTSESAFGTLKAASQSRLRFARYFWPSPGNYSANYFKQYFYWCAVPPTFPPTRGGIKKFGSCYKSELPSQVRSGEAFWRTDSKLVLFCLDDLEELPLDAPVMVDFSQKGDITPDGKLVIFAVRWLDGWSACSNGPTFTSDAGRKDAVTGNTMAQFQGGECLSCPQIVVLPATPHVLEFNPDVLRAKIEQGLIPSMAADVLNLQAVMRCKWGDTPSEDQRTGTVSYKMPLFSTSRGEQGAVQVRARGKVTMSRFKFDKIFMNSRVRLIVSNDKGSAPTVIYDSSPATDLLSPGHDGRARAVADVNVDNANVALIPDAKYTLSVEVGIAASFDFDHHWTGEKSSRFSVPGEVDDLVELTITELGITRPVGSGYQVNS